MPVAETQSANYESVAYKIPPFLQDDGTPSLLFCAWLVAYSSALLTYQVHEGEDLTDSEKNRLICNLLGDSTRQRLGLHMDGAHIEANAIPHDVFLHAIRLWLQDLVDYGGNTTPSPMLSGTGQPQHNGAIPFQADEGRRQKRKRVKKGAQGMSLWARVEVVAWGAASPTLWCVFCHRGGHEASACEMKRAAQLATPSSCSVFRCLFVQSFIWLLTFANQLVKSTDQLELLSIGSDRPMSMSIAEAE